MFMFGDGDFPIKFRCTDNLKYELSLKILFVKFIEKLFTVCNFNSDDDEEHVFAVNIWQIFGSQVSYIEYNNIYLITSH